MPPQMFGNLTPVVRALLYANFIVYGLQRLTGYGPLFLWEFALWPPGSQLQGGAPFEPWQIISYAFLHDPSNWLHLIGNMFALLMFGPDVERLLGSRRFVLYYFVCVVGAALTQLFVMHAITQEPYPTLGASGAIFGILLLFGLAFPTRRILLYFALPMPAWLFVLLYGLAELFFGVFGSMQGVAHFAHLGGMAAGAALILYWRSRIRGPQPRP
jgi:membrane associated rhomboid family serine protease